MSNGSRWTIIGIGALAALGMAAAAIAAVASNGAIFRDSRNETPRAPDISTVKVANDDDGLLAFEVKVPNRPVFKGDMRTSVYINADGNARNGAGPDFDGADLKLDVIPEDGIAVGRWVNGKWNYDGPQPETLDWEYNKGATMVVDATELGLKSFTFYAYFRDASKAKDYAPDPGKRPYSYVVK